MAGREEDDDESVLDEDEPPPDDAPPDDGDEDDVDAGEAEPSSRRESRRRRIERLLPDVLKRAIERGIETGLGSITHANDSIRSVVGKTDLPKDVAGYVFSQVDDTKNAMVRVVAREVREFLEAADLAKEVRKVLTTLSFEIRTEIRFVPNDAGELVPDVKAKVGPRIGKPRKRRGLRRPSAEAAELAAEDESEPPPPDDDET